MATNPEKIVLTYENLVEMPNDRQRYEIVDGELYLTATPNISHQTAVTNLTTVLNVHVRAHRLGRVFTAPCDVILEDTTVVEPDIIFVAEARKDIILPQHIRGAPDLVVEVLSRGTARTDREVKRQAGSARRACKATGNRSGIRPSYPHQSATPVRTLAPGSWAAID